MVCELNRRYWQGYYLYGGLGWKGGLRLGTTYPMAAGAWQSGVTI